MSRQELEVKYAEACKLLQRYKSMCTYGDTGMWELCEICGHYFDTEMTTYIQSGHTNQCNIPNPRRLWLESFDGCRQYVCKDCIPKIPENWYLEVIVPKVGVFKVFAPDKNSKHFPSMECIRDELEES